MQKHTALVFAATVLLITLAGACSSDRDSGTREVSASSLQEAERYLIDSLGETYYTALSCVLDKFPESLAYDFSALCDSTDLAINTTADGRLRFYSYDTHLGGTMIDFNTIVQWTDESGATHIARFRYPDGDDDDDDSRMNPIVHTGGRSGSGSDVATILNVHRLPEYEGKSTYIIEAYMREWSTLGAYDIIAVQLVDGLPQAVPLFIDKDGRKHTDISYEINIPYWYFTTKGQGWNWINAYDPAAASIYIPIMTPDGDNTPSGRYRIYSWINGALMHTRDGANYMLNPALADFESLEGVYVTDRHSIRIDRLRDGRYRYAAWPRGVAQAAAPDVTAYADEPADGSTHYDFVNEDYTYRVPTPANRDTLREMQILHKGKIEQRLKIE